MMRYTTVIVTLFLLVNLQIFNTVRVKRKVVFQKNSKFFIRLNGKTNILNATGIFAHGWAVRINYDLPDSISKMHKIFKRNTENLEENEFSTVVTSFISNRICEMFDMGNNSNCGIFCNIRKIINESKGVQADYLKNFLKNCINTNKTLM